MVNGTHHASDTETTIKNLARLARLLGYDENRAVVEVAEYAVLCQGAFGFEQKDTIRLLWHILGAVE